MSLENPGHGSRAGCAGGRPRSTSRTPVLYLHVIERKEGPAESGQRRGLPASQAIAPYVTPYPKYWENPSHSVAKKFHRWVPDGEVSADTEQTVIVQRIEPGAESDVARVFADPDAGPLPVETGLTERWLYRSTTSSGTCWSRTRRWPGQYGRTTNRTGQPSRRS
jgi:hypothetical protein